MVLMLSAFALTACSDDDVTGDPARDWSGTTTAFTPTDEQGFGTYYTPAIGRVGDPMPFYDKKAQNFKVLYLQEFRKRTWQRNCIFSILFMSGTALIFDSSVLHLRTIL